MSTPRWPSEDLEKLRYMWNEAGLSGQQISDQFGGRYSRKAVIGKARREKLDSRDTTVNRHLGGRVAGTMRPKPKPAVVPPPIDEPAPIGLVENFPSDRTTCRYIHGEAGITGWHLCGHPGHPWCQFHASKILIPPVAKARAPKWR